MIVFDRVKTIEYMDKSLYCALDTSADYTCLNNEKYILLPGFCDVHVHLREPGFSYKETIKTGSKAAARGGYTAVCTMPNLKPVCDSLEHLRLQREIIERDACIAVYPYAAITLNQAGEQLADLEALAPHVIAFSDDGHGVQSESMMSDAMTRANALGKMIVAHCEDNSLLRGGYIHDGPYARAHGHAGICSASSCERLRVSELSASGMPIAQAAAGASIPKGERAMAMPATSDTGTQQSRAPQHSSRDHCQPRTESQRAAASQTCATGAD